MDACVEMRRRLATALALSVAAGCVPRAPDVKPAAGGEHPAEIGSIVEAFSDSGERVRLRVDAIDPDPTDAQRELTLYGLSAQAAGSEAWQPYCAPDREGKSRAIPVEGSWDQHGDWSPGDGAITFACTSGAIGKCMRWGYRPWKEVGGTSLHDHHLACVRMVRADYCGNGTPHTRDGTLIEMFDPLGVRTRDPGDPKNPFIMEAGWSPSGATYLYRPRLHDRVGEIAAECPEKLAGRVPVSASELPLTPEEIHRRYPETLIINEHYAPR
ncbi:MAG TPA: ADYC domain-containing protein [Myxococcaceae bacterium]|nr:ADYC domain-containing protein [Myxococcaceae bacterium]